MVIAEARELISAFIPEEILRDFELKEVKKESGVYRLYMDKKDDESYYSPLSCRGRRRWSDAGT